MTLDWENENFHRLSAYFEINENKDDKLSVLSHLRHHLGSLWIRSSDDPLEEEKGSKQ